MMTQSPTLLATLPSFFKRLPPSHREVLGAQLQLLSSPLERNSQALDALYRSFAERTYLTLISFYGFSQNSGLGLWPKAAQKALLPRLPEYMSKRGTRAALQLAVEAILGVRSDQFVICERQFPRAMAQTDSLLTDKASNGVCLTRDNEEAFALTLRLDSELAVLAPELLECLQEFLKLELPIGIQSYLEFDHAK